jgi:hypothetical protein
MTAEAISSRNFQQYFLNLFLRYKKGNFDGGLGVYDLLMKDSHSFSPMPADTHHYLVSEKNIQSDWLTQFHSAPKTRNKKSKIAM